MAGFDPMSYVVPFNPTMQTQPPPTFGAPPVPPAVAARRRKDDKRDTQRKIGARVMDQSAMPATALATPPQALPTSSVPLISFGTKPTPPLGPATGATGADQLPQYTPPAPYTPPTFTPAQYHAPAKGLEYLGLGLSLLFPGSPIAGAAGGLLQGLQQRSQNTYQRQEKQAEQQYAVQDESARAAYEGALEKSKADFENAQLRYQHDEQLRSTGIDPATGKPMALPSIQSLLPKSIDPHTKHVSVDSSAGGYAQASRQLALIAMQHGAFDLAKQYESDASSYSRQAIDDANNQRAIALAVYNQNQQNAREDRRLGAEFSMLNAREDRADAREEARLGAEGGGKQGTLRDESMKSYSDFYKSWRTATTAQPPSFSNPTGKPAAISGTYASSLGKVFSSIDRDSDPAKTAQWYADQQSNPTAKQLILDRGRAADQYRRSQGLPILAHSYAKPVETPKLPSGGGLVPNPQPTAAPVGGAESGKIGAAVSAISHLPPQQQEVQIEKSSLSPAEKSAVRSALNLPLHVPGP